MIGVLYAEDFDAEDMPPDLADVAPEPELIEPLFTAAEVASVRVEAHHAGRIESEHGVAAARVRLLGSIAAALTDAAAAARQAADAHADAVAKVMLSALAACLPALCARHGAGEVRALARAVLPDLADEPRITVRVYPEMLSAMQAEAASLDPEIVARITWLGSEDILPGDARIAWQDGHAARNGGAARLAVIDALAVLGLMERENTDA